LSELANRVLLYETYPDLGRRLQKVLAPEGYDVTVVDDFDDALASLLEYAPQIALVNLSVESHKGLRLLRHIHQGRLLTFTIALLDVRIPALVKEATKWGCYAFLDKGAGFRESLEALLGQIQDRFAWATDVPGRGSASEMELLINLEEKAVAASLAGWTRALEFSRTELHGRAFWRISQLARESRAVGGLVKNGWRREGNRLLENLGAAVTEEVLPLAVDLYERWTDGWDPKSDSLHRTDGNLCVTFGGELELIGLPLELLRVAEDEDASYIALRHPVSRRVAGLQYLCKGLGLSDRDLWGRELLNVLLIAADVEGTVVLQGEEFELSPVEQAEKEASELESYFREDVRHLMGQIRILAGPEANKRNVESALREDIRWHIVHFAGHGVNHPTRSDLSALVLRPTNQSREPDLLIASELKRLMQPRSPRLIYLNACELMYTVPVPASGAKYHGVVGGLLGAGVPHILGFRWPQEDTKAPEFARTFYRALLKDRLPIECALLKSRQVMWRRYRHTSPIWASPVLIAQAVADRARPCWRCHLCGSESSVYAKGDKNE
jgi:DNA-binding response OmpR family regulator